MLKYLYNYTIVLAKSLLFLLILQSAAKVNLSAFIINFFKIIRFSWFYLNLKVKHLRHYIYGGLSGYGK